MERHSSGSCSQFVFGRAASSEEVDFEMDSPGAYFKAPSHGHISSHPPYGDQTDYALPFGFSMNYSTMGLQDQSFRSHQRHHSASAQSSHSSVHRSSDGSVFSSWQPRSSVASASTTWSQFSELSSEHYLAQAEQSLGARSPIASPPPPEVAPAPTPFKRAHVRQPSQDREPFLTCVSRSKRSRRSGKEPKYQCTACCEGFQQKYDWKRHEETYQERTEMFECELCNNIYFLDKDFIHHHQGSHRCQVCVPKRHVEMARKKRVARTGWGCGFCVHFSKNWSERCNHISEHFEQGYTMADWKHSRVIWSLIQRPDILREWCRLLETKQRTQNPFSWKPSTTGRSEGYPDTNAQPQLQDLLEFYTPSESAAAIAGLAFESGLREKELPSVPPPVPEKDQYPQQPPQQSLFSQNQHSVPFAAAVYDPMTDIPAWNRFLGTIPEDPFQPTNVVTLDYDVLNVAFNHTYDRAERS